MLATRPTPPLVSRNVGRCFGAIAVGNDRVHASYRVLIETFEKHRVAFVSVTQQFNTSTSMGRLVLNVLLSFAQFEREIISERTRDKIAAARRKGKWVGGQPVLGYDVDGRGPGLVVNEEEAVRVRAGKDSISFAPDPENPHPEIFLFISTTGP